MWYALANVAGAAFWPVAIFLNAIFWAAFGMLSAYLWARLFPRQSGYAPLVGCLSAAPTVLHVQMTTLTISSIGVLSAILCYSALLLILDYSQVGASWRYFVALSFIVFGILLSEYGVCVALSIVVLLARAPGQDWDLQTLRRARRSALVILAVTAGSYVLYHFTSDASYRPAMNPEAKLHSVRVIASFPMTLVSRFWHVTFGAYGALVENFHLNWGSKTLSLSLAFGCIFAWILVSNITESKEPLMESRSDISTIGLAVLIGLVPIALMRPYWVSDRLREVEFGSRFYIPVMPLAACFTTLLLLLLVRLRFRLVVCGAMGLLVGFALLNDLWDAYRQQRTLQAVGALLRPYVKLSNGNILGVLSTEELCFTDYVCTAKASTYWPKEMSKQFWLYKPSEALEHVGRRNECKGAESIDAGIRSISRRGAVKQVLWVEITDDDKVTVEPYCFADQAAQSAIPRHDVALEAKQRELRTRN
jgi:hypothetical protein